MKLMVLLGIMLFYSLLTFFIAPAIAYVSLRTKSSILYGQVAGFLLSLFLWNNYGSKMI